MGQYCLIGIGMNGRCKCLHDNVDMHDTHCTYKNEYDG